MKSKLVLVFAVLLFFGFSTFSCFAQSSNSEQRIIGTWVSEDGKFTFIFNANGSGTVTNPDWPLPGPFTFTYGISITGEIRMEGNYTENGKIYFSPDGRILIINSSAFRKR